MTTLFQKGVCTPVAVHSAISTDECTHKQKDISDDCNTIFQTAQNSGDIFQQI